LIHVYTFDVRVSVTCGEVTYLPYCKRPSFGKVGCKNSLLSQGRGGVTVPRLSGDGFLCI